MEGWVRRHLPPPPPPPISQPTPHHTGPQGSGMAGGWGGVWAGAPKAGVSCLEARTGALALPKRRCWHCEI